MFCLHVASKKRSRIQSTKLRWSRQIQGRWTFVGDPAGYFRSWALLWTHWSMDETLQCQTGWSSLYRVDQFNKIKIWLNFEFVGGFLFPSLPFVWQVEDFPIWMKDPLSILNLTIAKAFLGFLSGFSAPCQWAHTKIDQYNNINYNFQ